ncbi:anti-sigma factor [Micromonospora sp. BRA006-A]|nr:anti-sigma factor [Micromonospora sp. BRA006-A]
MSPEASRRYFVGKRSGRPTTGSRNPDSCRRRGRSGPAWCSHVRSAHAHAARAGARSVPALRRHRFALAAAAAAVVGVGGALAVTVAQTDAPPTEVALVGTDLAQQSRGEARVEDTPSGVKISIDVSGLPPAAAGTYYEGWVSGDRGSVAIGTST